MEWEERITQIETRLASIEHFIRATAPQIRIASLVVLGASLYIGGWLYRKVASLEAE